MTAPGDFFNARRLVLLSSAALIAMMLAGAARAGGDLIYDAAPGWYWNGAVDAGVNIFLQKPGSGFGRTPTAPFWLTPLTTDSNAKMDEYGKDPARRVHQRTRGCRRQQGRPLRDGFPGRACRHGQSALLPWPVRRRPAILLHNLGPDSASLEQQRQDRVRRRRLDPPDGRPHLAAEPREQCRQRNRNHSGRRDCAQQY